MLKKISKLEIINRFARKQGIEVRKYNSRFSDVARLQHLFLHHKVDLVLDVGANLGQYVKSLRQFGYSGRVVSFEPLSSVYAQLQTLCSQDPLWELAPRTAIGNQNDEITINISANKSSSSVLDMLQSHLDAQPKSIYCSSEKVKISRLDAVAQEYITDDTNSVFLKVDVQGFEEQVLEGAEKILPEIHGVELELSLVPLYKDQPIYLEMLERMEQLGYELHAVIPGFTDFKTGRLLQMDGVFFRK